MYAVIFRAMYAVIFRAEINELDESYAKIAAQMKELAINKYGCTEFTSVTEGTQEIAISYWQRQKPDKAMEARYQTPGSTGVGPNSMV